MLRNILVNRNQADEHENRTAHRIQHKIKAGRLPPLPSPAINQKKHRNQCRFPENIEERPILGKKHAQHAEFGQQDADVIALDPVGNAGGGEQCYEVSSAASATMGGTSRQRPRHKRCRPWD